MTSLYQFRQHVDDGPELPCFILNNVLSPDNCDDTVKELKDKVTLYPGMSAEVLIVTGERTLLQYLIDPIISSFNKA